MARPELPLGVGDRGVELGELDGAPVRSQPEVGLDLGELSLQHRRALRAGDLPVAVGVEPLDLLERRDLGLVEDVGELGLALVEADLGEVVDAEVAERVRGRLPGERAAGERRRDQRHEDSEVPHRSPSSARSDRGP